MNDDESNKGSGRSWSMPSWQRIGDFFLTVVQLERSYQSLKSKTDNLSESLDKLQRQVDEHSGQLKILLTFVQASLKDQVEMSAERAAARHLERLIAPRPDPPSDGR